MASMLRKLSRLLISCTLMAALSRSLPAEASQFVVNTADDTDDGVCDASHCSLREAIQAANANPGPDTISFSALDASGGHISIQLLSPLPPFTDDATTLDATTVQGYTGEPAIIVVKAAGAMEIGLDLQSSNNLIRGLSMAGYGGFGGQQYPPAEDYTGGAIVVSGSGNLIEGNDLGWGAWANSVGIRLLGPGNRVIGNVIGGNGVGVYLAGPGQVIQGNMIGTDASGNVANGNARAIYDDLGSGGGHLIGGPGEGEGNVLSASTYGQGILLLSAGNVVQGNRIGTNAAGTAALGNHSSGISLGVHYPSAPTDNLIGGSGPGEGNLISGNRAGITTAGDCQGTRILGNQIGSDISGSAAILNTEFGLQIFGTGITIGGLAPGEGNLILGNGSMGIRLDDEGNQTAILGNTIAQNGDEGVYVINYHYGQTQGDTLSRNSIFDNGGLGIRTAGIDVAPPQLTHATGHSITGTTCPNCLVELFIADPDPSGAGEGRTYLTTVQADANGNFQAQTPGLEGCEGVTATATNAMGNTSEFAVNILVNCIRVRPPFLYPLWTFSIVVFGVGGFLVGRRNPPHLRRFVIGGMAAGVIVAAGLTFLGDALPNVMIDLEAEQPVAYQGELPDCSSYLNPTGFSPEDGATLEPIPEPMLAWAPSGDLPEAPVRWTVHLVDTLEFSGSQTTEGTSLPLSAFGLTPVAGDRFTWSVRGQRLLPDGETWLSFCGDYSDRTFQFAREAVGTEAPTATVTVTPPAACTVPSAMATVDLACRYGPSQLYEAAGYLLTGESSAIEGRNADSTWWWVLNPDGQGHCWVWSGGVEVECVPEDLPVIAAPPLPTETVTCVATLDQQACLAAGGTWVLGAAALCRCP
jgi:CSLREA domain-containing protein